MPIIYPGAKHFFNHPGSGTYRDDPGYEIDILVDQLELLGEVLQDKVGLSESSAQDSPLVNTVLTSLTNGKSKWATIVTAMIAANAITNIALVSDSAATSTTSATPVDLTGMVRTFTTVGGNILALLFGSASNSTVGAVHVFGINLDGGADTLGPQVWAPVANYGALHMAVAYFTGVSAASHTVKGRWQTNAGTLTKQGGHHLLVAEFKK